MKKILATLKQKWAEYLLEIAVIIIGILAAYWLNQWNASIQDDKLLNHYVASLILDLEEQNTIIDKQFEYENKKYNELENLSKILIDKHPENQLDSLNSLLNKIMGKRTFHNVRVTYNDMISSGHLNLLNNASRRKVIIYYESLNRINEVVNTNNTTLITPLNIQLMTTPYFAVNEKNKIMLKQKLSDSISKAALQNIITTLSNVSGIHSTEMEDMREETKQLLDALKKD